MPSPVHPLDRVLGLQGWSRAVLDDLKEGPTNKIPLRLACKAVSSRPKARSVFMMVDVHAWLVGDKIRFELTNPGFASRVELQQLIHAGKQGTTPLAVGLTQCRCSEVRWNPLCLPLIWQEEMDDQVRFEMLMLRYSRLLQDPAWQCRDTAAIIK